MAAFLILVLALVAPTPSVAHESVPATSEDTTGMAELPADAYRLTEASAWLEGCILGLGLCPVLLLEDLTGTFDLVELPTLQPGPWRLFEVRDVRWIRGARTLAKRRWRHFNRSRHQDQRHAGTISRSLSGPAQARSELSPRLMRRAFPG